MRINYNVTGARRKELARRIADAAGEKAVYQGAPTFGYTIGDFTVTKDGTLETMLPATDELTQTVLAAIADAGFRPETPEAASCMTVEVPFTEVAVGNLTNLLEAKETLIRHALGISDLGIELKEDRVAFPWFTKTLDPETANAYTRFITALCHLSKELKRTCRTETPATNEKYAFRCFLLRLGFIGSEHKQERKILLKNLEGNASWKNGAPKKTGEVTA